MFDKIQHIGYLTSDLEAAVSWFERSFGAVNAGGGPLSPSYAVPSGGRNAYVRFGQAEAEIIEPEDKSAVGSKVLDMHHVGYLVANMEQAADELRARGFAFGSDDPFVNVFGHQVFYLDTETTNGAFVHLTQLAPVTTETPSPSGGGSGWGREVERIVHAGYLVRDADAAIEWYVQRFSGTHVGGGPSPRGGRNAFVNFGQVQVELIEPGDPSVIPAGVHQMDHVGYVVGDIPTCMPECQHRGLQFIADAPATNSIGQQVLYFDTATSLGSRMHLTRLPD